MASPTRSPGLSEEAPPTAQSTLRLRATAGSDYGPSIMNWGETNYWPETSMAGLHQVEVLLLYTPAHISRIPLLCLSIYLVWRASGLTPTPSHNS